MEEIRHHHPNDSIRFSDGTRIPIALHRLQLSESVRLVDWNARGHVLFLILQLLQTNVPQEGAEGESGRQQKRTECEYEKIQRGNLLYNTKCTLRERRRCKINGKWLHVE